jgi:hypothetical protein
MRDVTSAHHWTLEASLAGCLLQWVHQRRRCRTTAARDRS